MAVPSSSSLVFQQTHIHDDRRGGIITVNVLTLIIAYTAVLLRYLSRRLAGTSFGADDGWICVALVFVTGYVAGLSAMVHYGYGRHTILVKDVRALAISEIITGVFYHTGNSTIKISILFLYRRIFPSRRLKYVLLAVGAFTLGQGISFSAVTIFHCIPITALWTPHHSAKCVNYGTSSLISGILSVMTDILILASPMHAVWHLKVSKARKRLITATFLLGGIVSIISIVRLPYIRSLESGDDPSYDDAPSIELSGLEIGVGTLAACLPIYRPIYNRLFSKSTSARSADTVDKYPRSYWQLPANQPSIRLGLIGSTWNSNATPPRRDGEVVSYPQLSRSSSVHHAEGVPHSRDDEMGNEIMVTREFVMAASARSTAGDAEAR